MMNYIIFGRITDQIILIFEIFSKEKISRKSIISTAIWVLFNVHKTFYLPGAARPQYLNNRLSPIYMFTSFKNTIPALDRQLYSSGSAGNQHRGVSWSDYCNAADGLIPLC